MSNFKGVASKFNINTISYLNMISLDKHSKKSFKYKIKIPLNKHYEVIK